MELNKKLNIGIILLAAGSAERMKQNKLLCSVRGRTLLENVVFAAEKSKSTSTILVTGAYSSENLNAVWKYKIENVTNTNWKNGIGTSIKSGLNKALQKSPKIDAVIISVCDQPFLTNKIFDGLITTYHETGKKIIACSYAQSIGVPVLYDKSLFIDLLKIPDHQGAKKHLITDTNEKIITTFPFPKGEIDIDTLEDLKNLSPRPQGQGL